MAITDKYGFTEIPVGTSGWNTTYDANMALVENHLHTRLRVTLGEVVSQYDTIYINVIGMARKASTATFPRPAIGIALENGIAEDVISIQRVGKITNPDWHFQYLGWAVYLSAVAGGVTQTETSETQVIGVAYDEHTILLRFGYAVAVAATTTTTTNSTTTSSSTASTTTTSSSSTSSSTVSSTTVSSTTSSTTSTASTTSSTASTSTTASSTTASSTTAPPSGDGVYYPAVGGDDGYWYFDFDNSSGSCYMGDIGIDCNLFCRFPNVDIPVGATITSAYVRFTAFANSSGNIKLDVHFNAHDNAVAPANLGQAQGLALTANHTDWDAAINWVNGTQYNSPSLVAALQDVIDRGGWAKNNAVMVLILDDSGASSCEPSAIETDSGSEKMELHVEWLE